MLCEHFNVDYKILLLHIAVCSLTEICIHRFMSREMLLPYFWNTREKNQLLQTFKKINFRGAWRIWQTQLKLWIQWIQNFKDREQHHFYYIVLQELRAKIQLWVKWTSTKNISSIFDLAMHSKKRFIETISRKYQKLHLVCSMGWIHMIDSWCDT